MNVDIRSRGFSLSEPLRAHCERHLAFALSRFSARITRVVLRLADINGPRGGQDKQCSLVVFLGDGGSPIAVESTDADLYAAIARSADRVSQAVARRVQRSHAHQSSAGL
jgi:ribosomal subunit interface protein